MEHRPDGSPPPRGREISAGPDEPGEGPRAAARFPSVGVVRLAFVLGLIMSCVAVVLALVLVMASNYPDD